MLSNLPEKFTYPFCYTPHPLIVEASQRLISRIDGDVELKNLFSEGKMLGVMLVRGSDGISFLQAFSGNVSGRSSIDGFVPPIFDLMECGGYYKAEEARISEINRSLEILQRDSERYRRLKETRRTMSVRLQQWIFDNYVVLNALGQQKSVNEIFAERGIVPPGGTGDCAAPKLLQYAYRNGLKPLALGEFWYGASPNCEVRGHGSFYPSCLGKCGPLLEFMMEGLDVEPNPLEMGFCRQEPGIIYSDDSIVAVDKPSGMLSVPGKTGTVSLLEWLSKKFSREVFSCHRLDMDTSGVMVFSFSPDMKAALERQFAQRTVKKSYVARLSRGNGKAIPALGTISLPLALDYYDRPRQMVDFKSGKPAETDYELVTMLPDGGAIVRFFPRTGRTHQLRVHCAHHLGLGRPISGDRLYGDINGSRLMLHAESIEFVHPMSGEWMRLNSSVTWSRE